MSLSLPSGHGFRGLPNLRYLAEAGRKPAVGLLLGCVVAFYVAYHLTKFRLSAVWPPVPRGDAEILFDYSQSIIAQMDYPVGGIFPYSPSAVLILHGLGAGGPTPFMAAWYALMIAGLLSAMRGSFVQESQDARSAWLVIGTIGMLLASSPISWDLRNANSNLVYLGLVMAGYAAQVRMPVLAGALIGLSFSLKLYSALLLPWLLVQGHRRALGAAVATIALLWIVLPVALFGPAGTERLYAGWSDQLRIISDPSVHAALAAREGGPPLVTLQRAIVNTTGTAFQSATTRVYLSILLSIWVAVLLWYAWRCHSGGFRVAAPSRAALADWVVLLLAPLPFSPWLEPYHCVGMFVAVLMCAVVALDDNVQRGDRIAALVAAATPLLFMIVKVPFAVRGFGLLAQFLVFVIVLGYLRPRLRHPPNGGSAFEELPKSR
jgi:hypothetical protein